MFRQQSYAFWASEPQNVTEGLARKAIRMRLTEYGHYTRAAIQ
jgi:hypothetical protein